MSIIKLIDDLCNGITPSKRRALDAIAEQESRERSLREFERWQEAREKKRDRFRSSSFAMELCSLLCERVKNHNFYYGYSPNEESYKKEGIVFEIGLYSISYYNSVYTLSDGPDPVYLKYNSMGYNNLSGDLEHFKYVICEYLNENLPTNYHIDGDYRPFYFNDKGAEYFLVTKDAEPSTQTYKNW